MTSPRRQTGNTLSAGFARKPPSVPPDDPGGAAQWLVQNVTRKNGQNLLRQYQKEFLGASIQDQRAILAAAGVSSAEEEISKALAGVAADFCGAPRPTATQAQNMFLNPLSQPTPGQTDFGSAEKHHEKAAFEQALPVIRGSLQQAMDTLDFCRTVVEDLSAKFPLPDELQSRCNKAITDCCQVQGQIQGVSPTISLLHENCKLLHESSHNSAQRASHSPRPQSWADRVRKASPSSGAPPSLSDLEASRHAERQAKRKAAFGERRKNCRNDARSIQLKTVSLEQPTASGIVGRHFLARLELSNAVRIEDIR